MPTRRSTPNPPPALPSPSTAPGDAAVAERFRYFLDATGLTRETFVAAVDHAITAKSLFSVLSGVRRPSRALAVLIERGWGFRASFLLEGEGPMWVAASPRSRTVAPSSPLEDAVVSFVRRSVENARAVEQDLALATLWERVFARTMFLVEELEACARSGDPGDRAIYPLFVKLVYEEAQLAAALHSRLGALHVKRRVHRLTDRFLGRYLEELTRGMLEPGEHDALSRTLRPVLARRARALRSLETSIASLTTTLENLATLGSPRSLLEETARRRQPRRRALADTLAAALAEIPPGALAPALLGKLEAALQAARAMERPAPSLVESLQRLSRDLAGGLEVEEALASQSPAELRELHQATLAPLTG